MKEHFNHSTPSLGAYNTIPHYRSATTPTRLTWLHLLSSQFTASPQFRMCRHTLPHWKAVFEMNLTPQHCFTSGDREPHFTESSAASFVCTQQPPNYAKSIASADSGTFAKMNLCSAQGIDSLFTMVALVLKLAASGTTRSPQRQECIPEDLASTVLGDRDRGTPDPVSLRTL